MEVDHGPLSAHAAAPSSGTAAPGLTPAEERLLRATDPLHLPTPMDIDATVEAAMAAAVTAAAAAAAAGGVGVNGPALDTDMLLAALHRPNLYIVVDTNVLLRPDGVALLSSLRRRYAPRGLLAAADGGASRPLHCVAVVPWTVVAELDGLKGGAGGAGGCWVGKDKGRKGGTELETGVRLKGGAAQMVVACPATLAVELCAGPPSVRCAGKQGGRGGAGGACPGGPRARDSTIACRAKSAGPCGPQATAGKKGMRALTRTPYRRSVVHPLESRTQPVLLRMLIPRVPVPWLAGGGVKPVAIADSTEGAAHQYTTRQTVCVMTGEFPYPA